MSMTLYNAAISPYASRCRIQIYHKQLPVKIIDPPGGMGSDQVKAANPIGKIPVLDLGTTQLSESWAILGYLESQQPQPAMRPSDALAVAQQEELVRFVDLYLATAMFPLFLALRGAADEATVDTAKADLLKQLDILDAMLGRRSRDLELDLADAALLPVIWYAQVLARHFGLNDVLAARAHCKAWWTAASEVPAAKRVLDEMESGLKAILPMLFPA